MSECTLRDWQALGLEPGASIPTIKRAFRSRVKQCHPDVCGGDETSAARLKDVMRAYEHVTAAAEASARVSTLFEIGRHPAAVPCAPAPASSPTDYWLVCSLLERLHQSFQVMLLLVLLASPFLTLALGSAVIKPVLERYSEHRIGVRSHRAAGDDRAEYLRAMLLIQQRSLAYSPVADAPASTPPPPLLRR